MVRLRPVDAVEITLVVDNFVDVLMAGRRVRFPGGTELRLPPPSMADLEREGLEG